MIFSMSDNKQDIRWRQRFHNYLKAFQTLIEAVELAQTRAFIKARTARPDSGFRVYA